MPLVEVWSSLGWTGGKPTTPPHSLCWRHVNSCQVCRGSTEQHLRVTPSSSGVFLFIDPHCPQRWPIATFGFFSFKFRLIKIKFKIQLFSHTSYISSAHLMAGGCRISIDIECFHLLGSTVGRYNCLCQHRKKWNLYNTN